MKAILLELICNKIVNGKSQKVIKENDSLLIDWIPCSKLTRPGGETKKTNHHPMH